VIRQAISCDICGTEKKQTNHWFVAYDQGGELRVSGWASRNRLRPGSKHLCGQTCLHKLVDDFMARALQAKPPQSAQNDSDDEVVEPVVGKDTSLTSNSAYQEIESSARLIPAAAAKSARAATRAHVAPAPPMAPAAAVLETSEAVTARVPLRMPMEIVAMASRPQVDEALVAADEPPHFASRNWRAAAWERERERERELHAGDRRPAVAGRRRFST